MKVFPFENISQVFNHVYPLLEKQGFIQSKMGDSTCRYRKISFDTCLRCAIGHCIPDEMYDYSIENTVAREALRKVFTDDDRFIENNPFVHELRNLQLVHDKNNEPEKMKRALLAFAKKHGIIIDQI